MTRKIVDGKAVVSAKELEASGLSLRDFLNKEQGLTRKAPEGTKLDVNKPRNPDAKDGSEVQRAGTRYVNFPHTPTPSPAQARSLVDQGRGVQLYKDVDKEAVLGTGLGLASLYPGTIAARTAYGVARPAIGAAIKRLEDRPSPSFLREKDQPLSKFDTLTPENQAASQAYRNAYDDRPGPMKKGGVVKKMASGGKVSSASSRGDGIAQRGKTKGRMC
jgi:hypothetical protein